MATFSMPAPTRDEVRRGIFYVVISVFAFAAANVLVKWQVEKYPVVEVVFFRCLFSLLPCAIFILMNEGIGTLRTQRLGAHVGRASIQFLSMVSIFSAFGLMPLGDATAISFSNPLFLTILSIPLLGERVGRHRWAAVLVGFLGVLIMVRPGSGVFEIGAVFALANAFLGALVTIGIRRMSLTESSSSLLFYQVVVTGLISGAMIPFVWVTPSWFDFAALASIGLVSGFGQYWWMQAFRFAPAAVAAPFTYSALLWALLFGFIFWGDVPTAGLLAGALLVAASGLYIVYRETVRRLPVTPAPAATGTET